ncbi:uncharacterized protein Z520_08118 [Fonsecaea multimorphosa CBS 102226]|uniref:Uncharacterized protein n=1 Tax=Fonsecaea multimorphosa CBS 102226 TaxID=1442371 RepID=A0A0D2H3D5_9EURO|nr:uncharacterized protein Z520_08118 [Fonsecaea multimorphosa CBS 102226]KIX96340.1 hypothetical protein Z520_08118 [Fonsecaea multimorphosa CBS 102226]OAL21999.1 hypothetical protein AYO22_07596 [Fonsecaea multimorphosa]
MAVSAEAIETDLSALFDRYPDINFDTTGDVISSSGISEHFSSPCSNVTDHDDTPVSNDSTSTAHTTPLRPSLRSGEALELPTLDRFLEQLAKADLPMTCKEVFEGFAQAMAALGSLVVPTNGDHLGGYISSKKQKILAQTRLMSVQLRQSVLNVTEQINNIDFVKSRAPFTANPSKEDLWCIYRQRAVLITWYAALPCRTEQTMLEELAHVFDAYVYHPFLRLLGIEDVDIDVQEAINSLYDVLMTLLHDYAMWMSAMKDIAVNHMQPLMRTIRKCPQALEEIFKAESLGETVKASIGDSEAPGMQPADERVIRELNLSTSRRRPPIPPRSRQRYRREHTV